MTRQSVKQIIALVCLIGTNSLAGESVPDVVADYFHSGKLTLQAGCVASMYEYEDKGESGPGVGFGFLQVKYATPERAGLQFGAWWLAAKEIWENHDGDFDDLYEQDNDLRELYAKGTVSKTSVKAGRFGMAMSVLDGNSHQGVEIKSEEVANLSLRAAVVNRWINNDKVNYEYKGITGWVDVEDGGDEAGKEFWMGSVLLTLDGIGGGIEPFIGYQEKLMLAYGLDFEASHELDEERAIGCDGILAMYGNETPEEVNPDYEDVFSWLVHGYYTVYTLTVGIGWYGTSDNEGDITAGIFDTFDPMIEDSTVPFDEHNNAQLYYADASLDLEPFSIELMYGYGRNRACDVNSHELDAIVSYDLTESLQAAAFASYNNYSDDLLSNYTKMGLSLTYTY